MNVCTNWNIVKILNLCIIILCTNFRYLSITWLAFIACYNEVATMSRFEGAKAMPGKADRIVFFYIFPISFTFPLYQGNTISLPNCFTLLVDFRTEYRRLWHLPILAGMLYKKTDFYYCCSKFFLNQNDNNIVVTFVPWNASSLSQIYLA